MRYSASLAEEVAWTTSGGHGIRVFWRHRNTCGPRAWLVFPQTPHRPIHPVVALGYQAQCSGMSTRNLHGAGRSICSFGDTRAFSACALSPCYLSPSPSKGARSGQCRDGLLGRRRDARAES